MEQGAHSLEIEKLYERTRSRVNGLDTEEVAKALEENGPNELKEIKKETALDMFLAQFKNFLILILIASAIVSLGVGLYGSEDGGGDEVMEAMAILVVVLFIAVIGFIQEYRAEKDVEALKKMVSLDATVLRAGEKKRIHAREIVPGDILLLEAGDRIPADARIIEAIDFMLDEAALTGESNPVTKDASTLKEETGLADRKNMVYMGTNATYGKAKALVVATGMKTELGKIAEKIQTIEKEKTPLQVNLDHVGKQIGLIVIVLCTILFAVGTSSGIDAITMFMTAIALAVAAVPEGLPAVVTVTLSKGMRNMVKRNAIVKKLTAVETLGSTTVICSDKTGTLTRNEMTVRKIHVDKKTIDVTGEGYNPEGQFLYEGKTLDAKDRDLEFLLRISTLCNNSSLEKREDRWGIMGDPTEAALVVAASKANLWQSDVNREYPRTSEITFSSERKRMTTVHKTPDGELHAYSKGAPDVLLNLCTKKLEDGKVKELTEEDRKNIIDRNNEFAENALRVLCVAYRKIEGCDRCNADIEKDLVYVGLLGMIDPPREDAIKAVAVAKSAGIRTVVITGDHKLTAVAVAREMGIFSEGDKVLTGAELEKMSDDEIEYAAKEVSIYARVSPEHKLRIVKALKNLGNIAAMTGDGVNDAPALKKSDIGIAMGITGTDVSKEAADMILVDDNFASIVSAIEEGRGIYENIKLCVKYLLSCNIGEVLTIFIAMTALAKIPLFPLQILWMNIVTDAAPAMALAWNRPDPDIMKRKPRNQKEHIINKNTTLRFVLIGALMAAGTLGIFYSTLPYGEEKAVTMAFTTLVLYQMFYVLSCRSEKHTLAGVGVFSNKFLIGAVVLSVALQAAVIYVPFLQEIFETVPISLEDWLLIGAVSSTAFILPELAKLVKR